MSTKFRVPLNAVALGALLSLGACGGITPKLSTLAADAQQACVQVAPVLAAASAVLDPRVQSILGYANAVCGPLATGTTPATLDTNTPQWLGQLAGMLKVLAPVALSLL
jgi:hypothetical protein